MSLRIGKIDLPGVQSVGTEEARTLVEQRAPEQQGSVFQDLGREPVTILLSGFLYGGQTGSALETLRAAQARAEPQSFAADIAVGTELTDVVIEAFRVQQVAGFADRYQFFMRLREYVEPPQPASAEQGAISADVAARAAAWNGDNLAAAGVLADPASLPASLAANPGLLGQMDMADLGDSIMRNMDGLDAGALDGVVGAVAMANPDKALGLLQRLQQKGGMVALLAKYAQTGMDFISKVDPAKLKGALGLVVAALKGGLDFIKKLKAVVDSVAGLVEALQSLALPPEFAWLMPDFGA